MNADNFIMPKISNDIMKTAGALSLRLLIWIAQNNQVKLDDIQIDFKLSAEQASAALLYLEANKLIYKFEKDGAAFYSPVLDGADFPKYGNDVVENKLKENEYLKFLAYKTEQKLARPLTINEIRILYGAFDWLKLPVEVIIMLVDYCCEIDKKNLKYMEKIALEWSKQGINTIEAAQRQLNINKSSGDFFTKIKKLLGLNKKQLSLSEKGYIAKWEQERVSEDIILDAYEKTIKQTGRCALAYMNKIIMTDKDAKKAKAVNKKRPAKKSRYDFKEIERLDMEFLKSYEDKDI